MKRPVALVLLVLAAVLAFGWWRAHRRGAGLPPPHGGDRALFTDLVGREVWIPKEVNRIVLPRSKDVYLLAVLLGDQLPRRLAAWGPDLEIDDAELYKMLVARFPGLKEIPVTGSVYSDALDPEQVLQLRPDLVILDKFMLDRGYKYTARLEAAGLPLIYLDSSNDPLTGPQNGLRLLGQILGRQSQARPIVEYLDDQIRRVVSRIESNAPPAPSVYLESGNMGPSEYGQTYGPSGASGQRTSWGAILRALRVRNVAEGRVVGMAPIHPEALLKADPDVIVITGQSWSRWSTPGGMQLGFSVSEEEARRLLRGFTGRPGWPLLSAVREGRVHSVYHNTVSPTVFASVQALAKDCYPELFADLLPDRNLSEFFARFMPLPYQGTWMCGLK